MNIATLETDVLDIAKKIKAGLADAEGDAVKIASFVETNSTEITALASLAGSGTANATAVGLNLLNLAVAAVKDAGTAGAANGLSVTLDSATMAAVKAVIAAIEKI